MTRFRRNVFRWIQEKLRRHPLEAESGSEQATEETLLDGAFRVDRPLPGDRMREDLLGRSDFLASLARRLIPRAGQAGFVASIEGPWGSGKTTSLNEIEAAMRRDTSRRGLVVVHFNPWMVGSAEGLVESFFSEMASEMLLVDSSKRAAALAGRLTTYAKIVSFGKYLPLVGRIAELAGESIETGAKVAKDVAAARKNSIRSRKSELERSLASSGKRFLVIIDDVDRLLPSEMLSVFRLIKAVSDFPQVTYLVAYDPTYVVSSLELAQVPSAHAFLDKLIQVRLPLPTIRRAQLARLLEEETNRLDLGSGFDAFSDDHDRLGWVYTSGVAGLVRTPRDVQRLANRLSVSASSLKGEVRLSDLVALEAICLKCPGLYDHIRLRPDLYSGKTGRIEEATFKREKALRDGALERVDPDDRPFAESILKVVLPYADANGAQRAKDPGRESGMILNEENLQLALSSGAAGEGISLAVVREFIESDATRRNAESKITRPELIDEFLDLLQELVVGRKVDEPRSLLLSVSRLLDGEGGIRLQEAEVKQFASRALAVRAFYLLQRVVHCVPPEDRAALLRSPLAEPELFPFLVAIGEAAVNAPGVLAEIAENAEVDASDLRTKWIEAATERLREVRFLRSGFAGRGLARLRKAAPSEFDHLLAEVLEDDVRFDLVVGAFARGSWDSDRGRYANFGQAEIARFGDPNRVRARVLERLGSGQVLDAGLRAGFASLLSGKKEYFVDHES